MLGKTAGGLFWMFRYLERSENTARLIEAGFRIGLTRPDSAHDEWASVLETAGVRQLYLQHHDSYDEAQVINFLLREKANPSNVLSVIELARNEERDVVERVGPRQESIVGSRGQEGKDMERWLGGGQ